MLTDLKSVIAQIQETQSQITDKLDSLDHRVINLDLRLTEQGKSIDMLHGRQKPSKRRGDLSREV